MAQKMSRPNFCVDEGNNRLLTVHATCNLDILFVFGSWFLNLFNLNGLVLETEVDTIYFTFKY